MRNHPHILIFCSGLNSPGGAERAITNTANLFFEKGNKVTLLVLAESKKSFYPINTGVNVEQYHLHFGITKAGNVISRKVDFLKHIQKIKKLIERLDPTVIITTEYVHTIAARIAIKKSIKIISWEHHHFNWLNRNTFWQFLYKYIYPKIDLIVCLNKTEEKYYQQMGCNTTVIPNFITHVPAAYSLLNDKVILTIGWLIKRKGVDLVPAIAEIVFKQHP
ncbi:MAG: glycosyltransferase, partial [Chitinophagaceae bacterium]